MMIMALKLMNKKIKMNKTKTKTLHLETQKIQQERHLKKRRENLLIKTN
jgi:hypothetical protein